MSVPVIAAIVAAAVSVLVAVITAIGTYRVQAARMRTELRTEFMVEEAIRKLLMHPAWKQRSFTKIRHHIRGFEDNELRRHLVRAGAVAFDNPNNDLEWWGLRERNIEEFN
jgi:hypothetical protein